MIKIEKISKSFGDNEVLKNISIEIENGEIFCLLGPSGAGKTTLIRLMTGAIAPNSGEIIINGIKVPNMEIMKKIGFMPQNEALYNDLSGIDNLLFFGGLFGLDGAELKKKAKEMLKLVNLTKDTNKIVENYSGGMKKRLSLAIAMLHNPETLILDEPTVGIDPVLRRSIWEEFKTLKEKGKTIVVTTHVMDEVSMCDRAGIIYNGDMIAMGTIKELKGSSSDGSIEELFFMNKEGSANETFNN